jgi:chromosome condensin MukBEF ATPase and DNA-binding subunit MukB
MKRYILPLCILMTALISCNSNNTSKAYTEEFVSTFVREKNSFLVQQRLLSEQSERLDLMSMELLQSAPVVPPFMAELVVMKRTLESASVNLYHATQKMYKLNDEMLQHTKDQALIEKEWADLKPAIKTAIDQMQSMVGENENKFRELAGRVTGQPVPSGPRMPAPPIRPQ